MLMSYQSCRNYQLPACKWSKRQQPSHNHDFETESYFLSVLIYDFASNITEVLENQTNMDAF